VTAIPKYTKTTGAGSRRGDLGRPSADRQKCNSGEEDTPSKVGDLVEIPGSVCRCPNTLWTLQGRNGSLSTAPRCTSRVHVRVHGSLTHTILQHFAHAVIATSGATHRSQLQSSRNVPDTTQTARRVLPSIRCERKRIKIGFCPGCHPPTTP